MVDFKSRLKSKEGEKKVDPCELYESLDRAVDKGPLRPAQAAILKEWHANRRSSRDVILKLHTGQGKTLIGLLILQSKLNEGKGPALYLCPNHQLAKQTQRQAEQFGINFCSMEPDGLPRDFLDGKSILIVTAHLLFNGLTKFGLHTQSLKIDSIVVDDAHACIGIIEDSCKITLKKDGSTYSEIVGLFSSDLEDQGAGTFADIKSGNFNALLPVPYWSWRDRTLEVSKILAKSTDKKEIKFSWPIIRDTLADCQCVISGSNLEIAPHSMPFHAWGSFFGAAHRVFMSATISNDSFFIKGLGLDASTVAKPLAYRDEKWSGEKMVLLPSYIHPTLDRSKVVEFIGSKKNKRSFGVVVLCPGPGTVKDWSAYGAKISDKDSIDQDIEGLKQKEQEVPLVIINRYDGIDLPDSMCRILVLDSKPYAEDVIDRYVESCRSESDLIAIKTAQRIEQGMGRGVRGEKDFCVVILIGDNLFRSIKTVNSRKYFSPQTRTQIEIGFEISDFASAEIQNGTDPTKALLDLINQVLKRDEGWKDFYTEKMNEINLTDDRKNITEILIAERASELLFERKQYKDAVVTIQKMVDKHVTSESEIGWYLQEMARFTYPSSKVESNKFQIAAHQKNRYLLKPKEGMEVQKIALSGQKRIDRLIEFLRTFESNLELHLFIDELLSNLKFGVLADDFEKAMNDLANALGFPGQRPDKEWKEGPDNLWCVKDGEYVLIECKNEVELTRAEINKGETGQMSNSLAWFDRQYPGAKVHAFMVIPTKKLSSAAGFTRDVKIIREPNLKKLAKNVRNFYKELKEVDLKDLSGAKVQQLISTHGLGTDDLIEKYCELPRE